MPALRSNKGQGPINSDTYSLTGDLAILIDSLEVIVPVADRTEGDSVATARAAAGWAVTDARPLFVWNTTTNTIEVKDSTGWRGIGQYIRHQEFLVSTPFAVSGGSVNWDVGALVNNAAAEINTGFATAGPLSGQLTINDTGWYSFSSYHIGDASPGNCSLWIEKNNGTEKLAMTTGTGYEWELATSLPRILLAAGDTLRWRIKTNTARNWTSRVRIDKLDN